MEPVKNSKHASRITRLFKSLSPQGSAFRIALIYLIYGILWIITTDLVLERVVGSQYETYVFIQTIKGWVYVAITATFIYYLVAKTLSLYHEANLKVQHAKDELQQQYEKTLASEQRFDLAVKGSFDSIWEYDGNCDKYFISDSLLLAMGYQIAELKFETLEDWLAYIVADDRDRFLALVKDFEQHPSEIFEATYRIKRQDGSLAWIRTRGSSQIAPNGAIMKVAGSHTDITHLIQHQEALTKIAYYDRLTGLLNRHGFNQKIQERIEKAPHLPFSIMVLDIDDFKNINDMHGYAIGDKLLIEFSRILSQSLLESDLFANIGGDGFGLLIETTDKTGLLNRIAEIYSLLDQIKELEGRLIEVNVCIGIAQYPSDGKTFEELTHCADEAMYEAKNKGKKTYVFFTDQLHESHLTKIALINQLRKAVENNELSMMYQPIYKLNDSTLSSIEALCRWQPKGQGFISPDQFIPLAETSGLIEKIELWVFEEVFKQVVAWRKIRSHPIPVAINLSSKGICDDDFTHTIIALMGQYDLKAGEIEIEITETSLIQQPDVALKNLSLLRSKGINVLLDDFGKGYSSLTYLVSLPIDALKLDRGFTQRIHSSDAIDEVIASIINLAHCINLKVVAEGIEYENQRVFLASLGTDYGQGFYLHYPVLASDIEPLLK